MISWTPIIQAPELGPTYFSALRTNPLGVYPILPALHEDKFADDLLQVTSNPHGKLLAFTSSFRYKFDMQISDRSRAKC